MTWCSIIIGRDDLHRPIAQFHVSLCFLWLSPVLYSHDHVFFTDVWPCLLVSPHASPGICAFFLSKRGNGTCKLYIAIVSFHFQIIHSCPCLRWSQCHANNPTSFFSYFLSTFIYKLSDSFDWCSDRAQALLTFYVLFELLILIIWY